MIEGIRGGDVPFRKYLAGAVLGALLSATGVGGLGVQVGLGFYLPFSIVLTYTLGAVAREFTDWLGGKHYSESVGILIAAGLIVGANMETVRKSLERVVANITQLSEDKSSINTYDIHPRVDELFTDDLAAFVEARKAIAFQYGLQTYADIMSRFATAERYLNRCGSASADGYVDEVHAYLDRAATQFRESQEKIKNLE